MAGSKIEVVRDNVTLGGGIVSIPVDVLAGMVQESAARNGIVLANDRQKITIMVPEGDGSHRPVGYTLSLYVQRDAITDAERDAVNAAKSEGDAKKDDRTKKEREDRERAVKAAFDLGQSSTLGALRNLGDLAAGAAVLNRMK